jgi:hypothetical protein
MERTFPKHGLDSVRRTNLRFGILAIDLACEIGIESSCNVPPAVKSINIDNHHLSACVVGAQTHSLSVSLCIFRDYEDNKVIDRASILPDRRSSSILHFFPAHTYQTRPESDKLAGSIGPRSRVTLAFAFHPSISWFAERLDFRTPS